MIKNSIIAVIVLILLSCGPATIKKTPEELRAELLIQEESTPTSYVTVGDSTSIIPNKIKDAGLFSEAQYDGWLVSGVIKNTATIARFKDVVLTVTLYSQTQTIIDRQNFIIYEYFEPNSIKPFSLKINAPQATNTYHVTVNSATAAN